MRASVPCRCLHLLITFFSIFVFPAQSNAELHVRKTRMTYADPTNIESYPYVAFGRSCTASIIHERYLLTASHCYGVNPNPDGLSFFVGVDNRNELSKGVEHFADGVFGRDNASIPYDIALVRLAQPITFNSRAQPIKLNRSLILESEEIVTVTGFGCSEHACYSDELREGNFTFDNYSQSGGLRIKSTKNGLAAGDSGSPAVIYRRDNSQCGSPIQRYQVGIASSAGKAFQNGTWVYFAYFSQLSSPDICSWLKEKSNNEIEC